MIGLIVAAIVVLAGAVYGGLWVLAVLHANDWTLPGLVPLMNSFWEVLEQIPFPEALGPVSTTNLN